MYVLRAEGMVGIGRIADYKAWTDRVYDHLKQQAGVQALTTLQSAGYPSKFTGIIRWESRQAAQTWAESDGWRTFLKSNPIEGLFTPTAPTQAYEPVVFHRNDQPLGTITLVDVTIDFKPGNAEAFENRTRELIELHQKYGKGVVVSALTRFLGGGGRYTIGWGHVSAEDARATFATPEIARFMEANHLRMYASTPPAIEAHAVVKALVLQPVV